MINEESNLEEGLSTSGRKGKLKGFIFWLMMPIAFWFLILFLFVGVPSLENNPLIFEKNQSPDQVEKNELSYKKELQTEIIRLQKKLDRLTPGGVYLIVNTSDNTFFYIETKP